MPPIKIAQVSDIPEGGMICRDHMGSQILLAKVDGEIFAMDNVCTHAGAPLDEGELGAEGPYLVTCPWHDAHFDVRTGEVHQDTPWAFETEAFEVTVDGDDVLVDL